MSPTPSPMPSHTHSLSPQSFHPSCLQSFQNLSTPNLERNAGARGRQDGTVDSREGETASRVRTVVWDFRVTWGQKRESTGEGSQQLLGGMKGTSPFPSPLRAPANRPDLRARGAQDAKYTAKLFDVVLPWEKWGPVQQLPEYAAHGPADTEAKQLTDSHHGHRSPHTSSIVSHHKHRPTHTSSITPHHGHTSPHTSTYLLTHEQSSLEGSQPRRSPQTIKELLPRTQSTGPSPIISPPQIYNTQ